MPLRRALVPLLLLCTSFLASALLVEVALRIVGFEPFADRLTGRELILRPSPHPELRYELTPGARGFAWHSDVVVNSHGMRGREYPLAPTGALRIVALGDSVAFGSGVAVNERFTDLLETGLAERLDHPVEVLNLGVGGYDTLQEVASLEFSGLEFQPDLALLAYCVNDIGDNSPNLGYIRDLERLRSPLYRLRSVQLLRRALDRLRLMQRLQVENEDNRFRERNREWIAPVADDAELMRLRDQVAELAGDDFVLAWYGAEAHLGKLAYALDRLAALSQARSLPVLVAILPWLGESAAYDAVYALVGHMARSRGLPVLNLADELDHPDLESLRRSRVDPIHPNAEGHRLIAAALLEPLAEGLSRADPPPLRTGSR